MLNLALFSRSAEFWIPAPIENLALFSSACDFCMPAPILNLALFSRSAEFWIPAPMENLARFSIVVVGRSVANEVDGIITMAPAMKAAAIWKMRIIDLNVVTGSIWVRCGNLEYMIRKEKCMGFFCGTLFPIFICIGALLKATATA